MTDIDKLASELSVKALNEGLGLTWQMNVAIAARLGILEGERRERDKIADWLMKLAGDAAETLRSLNGKQTLTIAQNEEWERLVQQYTNLSESVRSGLPEIRSAP